MKTLTPQQRQEFVAELRSLGYSIKKIASLAGVSTTSVSRWFSGQTLPTTPVIERFRLARLAEYNESKNDSTQMAIPLPETISRRDFFAAHAFIALASLYEGDAIRKATETADEMIKSLDSIN